jgi:ABC-type multidrug transport system fused ATPase/permease subunit
MEFVYNIMSNMPVMVSIIGVNLIITILLLIITCICISKYNKLNSRYNKFMKKLGQGEKIEEILSEYIKDVSLLKQKNENQDKELERLENNLKKCVQKVGVVRYNAYNDTGSDLSFTLALMDAADNGVVVNGLYSRESSSIFAKPLIKGETRYNLSAEEIQAIDIARTSSISRY